MREYDYGSDYDGRKAPRHGSVGPSDDGALLRHASPPDAADGRTGRSRLSDDVEPRVAPVALCEAVEASREVLFFVCARFLPSGNLAQVARNRRRPSFVAQLMSDGTQLRVVYDAECSLCRGARSWVERRNGEDCILFEPADEDIPAEARVLTVRAATEDRLGFDGWVEILRHLPRWRRLAPVLAWKPIWQMGSAIYGITAAHRHRFLRPSE